MAALTSNFERRMREILPPSRPGKRKVSFPTPSTSSRDQWDVYESRILETFEKRKKIAQGPRPTLVPSSFLALHPTRYIFGNSDVLNASSSYPRFERYSRSYAPSPPSYSRRAVVTDPSSVAANVHGGRVRSETGGSPMSWSTLTRGSLQEWWTSDKHFTYADRRTVGNSSESGDVIVIAGHYGADLNGARAQVLQGVLSLETSRELVDGPTELGIASDSERELEVLRTLEEGTSVSPQRSPIQVLRSPAEDLLPTARLHQEFTAYRDDLAGNSPYREFIASSYEGVNRARAQDLKEASSVEAFRELMNAPTESIAPFSAKNQALEDQENSDILEDLPAWKRMFNNVTDPTEKGTQKEIAFLEAKLEALQLQRPPSLRADKKIEEDPKLVGAFTPLSDEAEQEVEEALQGSSRSAVLVLHENSNIEVTEAVMQCLLPGAWLNDEVINVYMELLKEREVREHDRFMRCHFFNTFFYNKLYKDKRNYDYKAIRRWTTAKKLGYSLCECDKILVPIHQDIHWCLAVINIKEKKLEYLDSLRGGDRAVLDVLARYISDEARDKSGRDLDAITWERSFPKEIPEQLNGCDCGMFMLKYADFHSRDAPLSFTQDHMNYFRRKMVWEILKLEAT